MADPGQPHHLPPVDGVDTAGAGAEQFHGVPLATRTLAVGDLDDTPGVACHEWSPLLVQEVALRIGRITPPCLHVDDGTGQAVEVAKVPFLNLELAGSHPEAVTRPVRRHRVIT